MSKKPQKTPVKPTPNADLITYKICSRCGEPKPVAEFLRRTGRHAGKSSRRDTCRACRKAATNEAKPLGGPQVLPAPCAREAVARDAAVVGIHPVKGQPGQGEFSSLPSPLRRPVPVPPSKPAALDASVLRTNRNGVLWMRGKTDKGRRWQQETDLQTATVLVQEHAAVIVNRSTIRRLYSNKMFRHYILTRDRHTCYFCGGFGDTIDHLLPRAKGGHTTPVNCVCACSACNQSKADRHLDAFLDMLERGTGENPPRTGKRRRRRKKRRRGADTAEMSAAAHESGQPPELGSGHPPNQRGDFTARTSSNNEPTVDNLKADLSREPSEAPVRRRRRRRRSRKPPMDGTN